MNNPNTVNFVIGGTQKGGTTALYSYLSEHKSICMPANKEAHFFDNDRLFTTTTNIPISAYHRLFTPKPDEFLLGDATPMYMYHYEVPKRIWFYNKSMKWILVLRNPVERAYSHWYMETQRGNDTLPFLDALRCERERALESGPFQHRVFSYMDRGCYLEQIRRIWNCFSVTQTLIIKSDELRKEPQQVLDQVCDFLQIERMPGIKQRNVFSQNYSSRISEKAKSFLLDKFEYEIRSLEKEFSWDCSDWLQ